MEVRPIPLTFTAFFPFCGLGAGALGFLNAEIRLLGHTARFESVGGIDIDPEACKDFERLTGSPSLCVDLHELSSKELRTFIPKSPDIVFASPPCKGFSALLSKKVYRKKKYQRLNRLVIRWLELMVKAWPNDLPSLILFENVPRITSRGAGLLNTVRVVLGRAGYKIDERLHDCGEIGGLAQHRRRYLMVARLPGKCPPFLYKPPIKRVMGCGEVLSRLPVPGTPAAAQFGKIHEMPRINLMNMIRLALIPAGGDWRDIPGVLEEHQKRREVHKRYGVADWSKPTSTISGSGTNGGAFVADPRMSTDNPNRFHNQYRVMSWDQAAKTVIGATRPGSGAGCVADPRTDADWYPGILGVKDWDAPSSTVTGMAAPGRGRFSISDPRLQCSPRPGAYGVLDWKGPSRAVVGHAHVDNSKLSVADPRVGVAFDAGYKVLEWGEPAHTVAGKASCGTGAYQVADPRVEAEGLFIPWEDILYLPALLGLDAKKPPPMDIVIISPDGCWHRPMTTLELAALQGLPLDLQLEGRATSRWRERIGNAVPVQTAEAIATQMLVALTEAALNSDTPPLFTLPKWVVPWSDHAVSG